MPEQQPVQRKLVAILAADIAGYSRLVGLDEEGTLARLRALRRELIDPTIAEHRGRIVKTTGDGILLEFASVVDAVRCAVAVQRATADRESTVPEDRRIQFRVGINLGDIVVEGDDILGDGVNVAARLEGIAAPGSICISEDVYRQVRGKAEVEFADLGEQSLKNIAHAVRVYRVMVDNPIATPAATLPLPDKPSIAVLPFQNLSGDTEQEYFADGMVEEITTALSKLRWFFVIARNSAFTYKGRAVDVKRVGRELGVRYVLEGSVRRAGSLLRITAQLVDAASGNHLWANRYDRDLADIFAVQDEITECVVAAIEPELYAAEHIRAQRKPPENLDAWECVIRALSCIGHGTQKANTEAEVLYRRAIAITPEDAQPHSLLAWTLWRRAAWSGGSAALLPEAMAEALTATRLDERDPWAHLALGTVLCRLHRYDEARQSLNKSLELNPNFALAHTLLAAVLAYGGAEEEAITSAERGLRLSPAERLVGAYGSIAFAHAYFGAGRYPECAIWARETIKRAEFIAAHCLLVAAMAIAGDERGAASAAAELLRKQPAVSIAWVYENTAFSGEQLERLEQGLRKVGIPER